MFECCLFAVYLQSGFKFLSCFAIYGDAGYKAERPGKPKQLFAWWFSVWFPLGWKSDLNNTFHLNCTSNVKVLVILTYSYIGSSGVRVVFFSRNTSSQPNKKVKGADCLCGQARPAVRRQSRVQWLTTPFPRQAVNQVVLSDLVILKPLYWKLLLFSWARGPRVVVSNVS